MWNFYLTSRFLTSVVGLRPFTLFYLIENVGDLSCLGMTGEREGDGIWRWKVLLPGLDSLTPGNGLSTCTSTRPSVSTTPHWVVLDVVGVGPPTRIPVHSVVHSLRYVFVVVVWLGDSHDPYTDGKVKVEGLESRVEDTGTSECVHVPSIKTFWMKVDPIQLC